MCIVHILYVVSVCIYTCMCFHYTLHVHVNVVTSQWHYSTSVYDHSFLSPVPSDSNPAVKQTACLCLLKLLRVDPRVIPVEKHASKIIKFLGDKHLVSRCGFDLTFTGTCIYMMCLQKLSFMNMLSVLTKHF